MTPSPELFWISGSPPSWRVMLALTLKGVDVRLHRLDHAAGENRTTAYLALNPKGQVPTLRHGPIILRESLAILAYLDRAWPDQPLFGADASQAAAIWQDVALFEADLGPAAKVIAPTLLRNQSAARADALRAAITAYLAALDGVASALDWRAHISAAGPSASDCWLFPTVHWIARAIEKTSDPVPPALRDHLTARPALQAWCARIAALPGVAATYPPHWGAPE